MNEFKPLGPLVPRDNRDKPPQAEPASSARDVDDLPISNWDEYKKWCEKVKENWDVN
ncbi:MAG: hypothetical protein AAF610_13160 [Pseudomonadota bacterium]